MPKCFHMSPSFLCWCGSYFVCSSHVIWFCAGLLVFEDDLFIASFEVLDLVSYIYAYIIYVHTCTCTCLSVCIYVYMYAYIFLYTNVCVDVYVNVYYLVCMCLCFVYCVMCLSVLVVHAWCDYLNGELHFFS